MKKLVYLLCLFFIWSCSSDGDDESMSKTFNNETIACYHEKMLIPGSSAELVMKTDKEGELTLNNALLNKGKVRIPIRVANDNTFSGTFSDKDFEINVDGNINNNKLTVNLKTVYSSSIADKEYAMTANVLNFDYKNETGKVSLSNGDTTLSISTEQYSKEIESKFSTLLSTIFSGVHLNFNKNGFIDVKLWLQPNNEIQEIPGVVRYYFDNVSNLLTVRIPWENKEIQVGFGCTFEDSGKLLNYDFLPEVMAQFRKVLSDSKLLGSILPVLMGKIPPEFLASLDTTTLQGDLMQFISILQSPNTTSVEVRGVWSLVSE